MRAVLSPPEPDGQILYRPYMDSYKRTPKTEVCQVLFAFMTIIRYVCREINCGNPRNTKSCVKRGKNGSKIARKWSI